MNLSACIPAAFLLVIPFLPANVQDPKPAAGQEPKAAANDVEGKVRELLDVTNASQMGQEALEQMLEAFRDMPGLPDGFIEKFKELAKPQELVELIVPVYVKHLDAKDIDPLVKFFQTDVGKRWIAAQKPILKESMKAGQDWGRALGERVAKELAAGK